MQGLNLAFTLDSKRSPTEACRADTDWGGDGVVAQSSLHGPTTLLGVTEPLLAIPIQKEKSTVNTGTHQVHPEFF